MILLDTCALVFDALSPGRLTAKAQEAIEAAERESALACSDISLWEVAMRVKKGRLDPGTDGSSSLELVLAARTIRALPITPEIARLSLALACVTNQDPAGLLNAATALCHQATLVTSDKGLLRAEVLLTLW